MNQKVLVMLIILVVGGVLLYWNNTNSPNNTGNTKKSEESTINNQPQKETTPEIDNKKSSADEYCTKNGGSIKKEKRPDGTEYGLCYFEDNRACEVEAMENGECPIGGVKTTGYDNIYQRFCAWSGGKTIAEVNAKCTFKDGSVCSNEEYYFGTCSKGAKAK